MVVMNEQIIKQNLFLVTEVTRFILQNPSILDQLPPDFKLVILPEDVPELSLYNLSLLADKAYQDKPVVMVRLEGGQANFERTPPQLYVPLAV